MNFESSLSIIAQDIYNNYYSKPYPNGMRRTEHGMSHVVRAMIFGTIAYKLMCMSGLATFKSSDLKLIQIALLLHDSGRQGEGKDLWDKDSAQNIYDYLTKKLGVPSLQALDVAESMLNKDWSEGGQENYQKLDGSVSTPEEVRKNQMLRLAIQFGDCIDIYRIVEKKFNWDCVHLYQPGINHPQLKSAIEQLLPQSFEFISGTAEAEIKDEDSYQALINALNTYPLAKKMFNAQVSRDAIAALMTTGDEIKDAFYGMRLLFRGVTNVSSTYERHEDRPHKTYNASHTQAEQEVRKLMRRPTIATWARTDSKKYGKTGNPSRSVSLLGVGGTAFTTVGGAVLLDNVNVIMVSQGNLYTGYGPKAHLKDRPRNNNFSEEISAIRKYMRSGQAGETHNEIVADITTWDCILYSTDNDIPDEPRHSMRLLHALYLKDVYKNHTGGDATGTELPVYKFSTKTGMFEKVEVTDALIAAAFQDALLHYVEEKILSNASGFDTKKPHHLVKTYVQQYIALPEVHLLGKYASATLKKTMQEKILWVIAQAAEGRFEFQNTYVFPRDLDESNLGSYLNVIARLAMHGLKSRGAGSVIHAFLKQITTGQVGNDFSEKLNLLIKISTNHPGYYHDLIKNTVKRWLDIKLGGKSDPLKPTLLDSTLKLVVNVGACNETDLLRRLKQHYADNLLSHIECLLRAGHDVIAVFISVTCNTSFESVASVEECYGEHYTPALHKDVLSHIESERLALIDKKLGLLFFSLESNDCYNDFFRTLNSSQKIKLIYDYLNRSGKLAQPTVSDEQRNLLTMLQQQALLLSSQAGDSSFFKINNGQNFQNLKQLFNHDAEAVSSASYRPGALKITPLAHYAMRLSKATSETEIRQAVIGLKNLRLETPLENRYKRKFNQI